MQGRSSTQNGDDDLGQRHEGPFKGDLGNSKYLCFIGAVGEQLYGAQVYWMGLVAVLSIVGLLVMYGHIL